MAEEQLKSFEKLAKGSYFLILDNIVNLSLGALFWIVLAKLIDAAPLGQAMVAVAFATSVIGFAGYGVQVTISKYMSEYNAKGLPKVSRRILSLGIKLALIVSASVAVVIALLSGYIASEAYQDSSMAPVLLLAVLTFLPSQTVVSALMGAYQGTHKMKFALITDSIYQVIRLGVAVFLVMAEFGSFGIIMSFAVASIIASILGYVYFVPRLLPRNQVVQGATESTSQIKGIGQIVKFSGHNYAAVGMKTLTAQIGVLIVGTQNFELAAFYGLSVLISNLVGGVLNAVSRAMLPTATEEWTVGNKAGFGSTLDAGIRLSMLISGIGFLVLMIQPDQVLGLISEQYVEASDALRILVVSSIAYSLGAILTSMLNAANRAAEVAKIGIVSASITIGLTFVLTPILYIEGAAIALLLGSIASLVMSIVSLKRKEGISISARSTLKPAGAMVAGVAVAFAVMTLYPGMTLASLALALAVYLAVSLALKVTTRKEVRMLARLLRKSREVSSTSTLMVKKSGKVGSLLRNNSTLLAKISVLIAAILVVYGSDLSVVFTKALTFSAGNITNYVLVIPALILFVLHRKRRILLAVASWNGRSRNSLRLDDVLGAALCAVGVIVYVIGTTSLYSMELHLISLPIFVAGATMLLFNIATLRHSFICIIFLAYLQPPPADLLAEIAADMSWSSAVLVQYMLGTIGLPISLDASFGAPALVMQDPSGAKVPFYVGEPSSGTYSIVSLSVFSIFVAYVLRGKLWKRALILVIGFPVFYLLNALRIALIISIWYTSGADAAESFHVVSGAVMSAIGTLILLFFADLVLRLGTRAPRQSNDRCPSCEKSLAAGESLCLLCGRLLKRYSPRLDGAVVSRMVLLAVISSLVVAAQVAAIQNTGELSASELTLYNLNIDHVEGPETAAIFFPQIDGWDVRYAFRDTRVEGILNQDATLAYRYTSNATTATGSKPAVNAGLQISRTLHTWEGSLLVYPSKFGRPSATVVDIGWIPATDDKLVRFFAYKKPGQEYTEAVLYWTDKRELRFDSGIESRNVQIILHVNVDSLARMGAIDGVTDTEGVKKLLLSLARPIIKHWDEISVSTTSARTLDAILTRRPYLPLGITIGIAVIFALAILSRTSSIRKSNRRLYEQIKVGEEKLILDSIADNSKSARNGLTGEAIVDRHPALSSNVRTAPRFIDMFRQMRNVGLIEDRIHNRYDEPVLVWRPNFHTASSRRKRQLGDLMHY